MKELRVREELKINYTERIRTLDQLKTDDGLTLVINLWVHQKKCLHELENILNLKNEFHQISNYRFSKI